MSNKINSVGQALIVVAVLISISCSKNSPTPASSKDPKVTSVDKNYLIDGEIITIRGVNFSKNVTDTSQIIAINVSDTSVHPFPLAIISRTPTQIVAVMKGRDGVTGTYNLSYFSKSDTSAANYASNVYVNVVAPATGQFNVSSNFTANNLTAGSIASFGAKYGTLVASDYTVTFLSYDFNTGLSSESPAQVDSVNAKKFDGLMDKVSITVPGVAPGKYEVKVTYANKTLIAGWNTYFIVN